MAELYLETNGEVLNSPSVPTTPKQSKSSSESSDPLLIREMQKKLEQLESDYINAYDHLEALIEDITIRLEVLEK